MQNLKVIAQMSEEIARLRHDNSELIKNCLTIAEVEKIFKTAMDEMLKLKDQEFKDESAD